MRFAILAQQLSEDIAHTVVAIDGDTSARILVPAKANVSYGSVPRRRWMPARLKSYRRYLRTLAPDILVTYNWGAIEWAMVNFLVRIPHIHMEDGFGPEEVNHQLLRRVWMRRLILRRSAIVVPSQSLREIAASQWKMSGYDVRYIPNGVTSRDADRAFHSNIDLFLPTNLPKIVWAGAFRPEKNPLRLLQAFAPLRGKAVLVLLGDGPQRAFIEQEAARLSLVPHILFLGNRTDARDIIMQCDIMALSSDTEQMPFAILEAMDAGLAIASVDVGDICEMVAPENRPFIVNNNAHALSQAMERLATDLPLRTRVGEANRQRLRARYSSQAMAAQYHNLFHSVVNSHAARSPHV
jgi:glycosyltransferase involved in cell wall biosynthesis